MWTEASITVSVAAMLPADKKVEGRSNRIQNITYPIPNFPALAAATTEERFK